MQGIADASIAFTDINRLAALKTKTGREGIEAAAKQFESLFIDLMLKGMREANRAFSEGNYTTSSEMELHQEMLDHEYAVHLADNGGIGLKDVIVRQLTGEDRVRRGSELGMIAPSTSPTAAVVIDAEEAHNEAVDTATEAEPVSELSVRSSGRKESPFDGPLSFVERLLPIVKTALAGSPLNPLAVLAQAALETGWGKHVIHAADGTNSHNLFGMKAGESWPGKSVEVTTLEFRGGRPIKESASFRAYDSWLDALEDYRALITGSERYSGAVDSADEPDRYATELQNAGYATDPDYASKIRRVLGSEPMLNARRMLEELISPGE